MHIIKQKPSKLTEQEKKELRDCKKYKYISRTGLFLIGDDTWRDSIIHDQSPHKILKKLNLKEENSL